MTAARDQGAFEIWNQPTRASQCRWRVVQHFVLTNEQQHWNVQGAQFVVWQRIRADRGGPQRVRRHSKILHAEIHQIEYGGRIRTAWFV